MTKDELVAKVAGATTMPKTQVNKMLKATLGEISKALATGEKISFVGFGTFDAVERKARVGRNPKTGEELKIPATIVPKFKAGKNLREMVRRRKR
jgi:DNA-binding protein HU-beta